MNFGTNLTILPGMSYVPIGVTYTRRQTHRHRETDRAGVGLQDVGNQWLLLYFTLSPFSDFFWDKLSIASEGHIQLNS